MARLFLTRWLASLTRIFWYSSASARPSSANWRSSARPTKLARPCRKARSAASNSPALELSTSSTPHGPEPQAISTLMARRTPCSAISGGVRKRASPSNWLQITGEPVWNAKPAGEPASALSVAWPTTPSRQPTPERISSSRGRGDIRAPSRAASACRRPPCRRRSSASSSMPRGFQRLHAEVGQRRLLFEPVARAPSRRRPRRPPRRSSAGRRRPFSSPRRLRDHLSRDRSSVRSNLSPPSPTRFAPVALPAKAAKSEIAPAQSA